MNEHRNLQRFGTREHTLQSRVGRVDVLIDRASNALQQFRTEFGNKNDETRLVVAGGVAANQAIRVAFQALSARERFALEVPPFALCTDNGAMVAWAGLERLARGWTDELSSAPRARWPLETLVNPKEFLSQLVLNPLP
jgi:N6-L-threonylcarbamoyladenine synthase